MARRVITFEDFSGGEWGDLGPFGAQAGMFNGSNVMRYNDGSIGPRPGTKALAPTGAVTGTVWGFAGLGAQATRAQVFGIGSNVYGFTLGDNAISALGTVSTTATTASQIIQYGAGKGQLTRYNDKTYQIDSLSPVVTPLSGSPGAKTLAPYGIRLIAANYTATATATVLAKRVAYSAAADLTSWPALNFFDVGNIDWGVTYLDEIRQRLVIANEGGEWWALTGTPGVNDSLRRQPRSDVAPLQWYHAARLGETIWFFPSGEDFPAQFTGIVVDKLRFKHLRFTDGDGSDWSMHALPVSEMLCAFEDGGDNRGMLLANDAWSYQSFGITTSKFNAPASIGGAGADLDMPLVMCNGGGASPPTFATFHPGLDRPGKTSDTYAQPGDNSTTPLTASLNFPAIMAKDGYDLWAKKVTVHGFKWNTGSASTNHFDLTVRRYLQRNSDDTKDSASLSFDEAASATTSDRTPFSVTFGIGDQQRGHAVQVRLSALRGVAIEKVEVDCDEETAI